MAETSVEEHINNAEAALVQGQTQEALRHLIYGFGLDASVPKLYDLASRALMLIGGDHEAGLFRAALDNFEAFDPYFRLGTHFVETRHYDLAIAFLQRALSFNPESLAAAHELALVLPARFRPKDAALALARCDFKGDFWASFQYYYCLLLIGKTEGLSDFIAEISEEYAKQENSPEWESAKSAVDYLEEMYIRLSRIGEPQKHIRDWHFIQYGGVILDFFNDSEEYVAGGRYVASWGTYPSIHLNLQRLQRFFEAMEVRPKLIVAMPDRNSRILAMAFGKMQDLEVLVFDGTTLDQERSLVIAAENSAYDGIESTAEIAPGQWLFAYNLDWLSGAMISPDMAASMNQVYTFPWQGGGMAMDPDTGKLTKLEEDSRPEEEIVGELLSKADEEGENFASDLAFYRSQAAYLTGGNTERLRRVFRVDSPVPGSFFT